ncbi:MAG: type VII toxin-antitoxin system MntA family adenylyltransferase antitoxin [Thermodesulfobacteriota bacterium]
MHPIETEIKRYFADKEEAAAVYLFGSHARGRETAASDVDIAVLMQRSCLPSAQAFRKQYMAELGGILKKDIHPVVMNHAGELLLKQIFSKGKRILARDPAFDAHFTMIAYSRIMDFTPYLKQMQEGLKKRMLESGQ